MKRKIVFSLSLVLLLSVGILATIAYFTDDKTIENTFTVGSLKIELEEDYTQNTKILPGLVIDKKPYVTVKKGSEEAYVFICLETTSLINSYIKNMNIDKTKWEEVYQLEENGKVKTLYLYKDDGTNDIVDAKDSDIKLKELFSKITIKSTLNNIDFKDFSSKDKLLIKAFAHQAKINNVADYDKAFEAAKSHFDFSS